MAKGAKIMLAAIIQARTGSTRFPNKIFADISGKPLISHVVDRLRPSKYIDQIILATTMNTKDDVLEKWCSDNGVQCFRGSEDDVLSRYYHAAEACNASEIVRVTADDFCKDYRVIDSVVELFRKESLDFAYNNKPPSFPEGLDTEVFSRTSLGRSFNGNLDDYEREHVTQYMYRRPEIFKQKNFAFNRNVSSLRLTIDTEDDLTLAREIYRQLYTPGGWFGLESILDLFDKNPNLAKINSTVKRSTMYA
jgi:spore coat polysaccharide biosynthesis protein SpsF